jgi:hypothetical protein
MFDDVRSALVALLSQPFAVAILVIVAGLNAALWLLVFERAGFPGALATLLLVPPLTFLLPLYVALARWPSEARPRFLRLRRVSTPRPTRSARPSGMPRVSGEFHSHLPMRLAADGLPVVRIPLVPTTLPETWPGARGLAVQDLYATLGQRP